MEDHQHTKLIAHFHQTNYTFLLMVYATNNLKLRTNDKLNFHEQRKTKITPPDCFKDIAVAPPRINHQKIINFTTRKAHQGYRK